MPNFPGDNNAIPDTYVQVETLSNAVSIPSGVRLSAIMGEGVRRETLVASANGGGNDGLDPTFTTTNGRDGRHFRISSPPIISNRTTLFKNGILLNGTEGNNDGTQFPSNFDYRVDTRNGTVELQTGQLVDQGGSFYRGSALNSGNGIIDSLTLVDTNAPSETWIIRCTSARRDGYGDIVPGFAKFVAFGSVSGNVLDGYGNVVTWQSDNTVNTNSILRFGIQEGIVPFREGDSFIIEVRGGVLLAGDSLVINYIAVTDLNDPQFFTDLDDVTFKHGLPSISNTLSLGAQLAFANQPPGIFTVQCAPSVPRRASYDLVNSASGNATLDDLTFNLPVGVIPDSDSNINFFVTDPITGVESQILPNKVSFFDPSITTNPSSFVFGTSFDFSYTVIIADAVVKDGDDGVLTPLAGNQARISSSSVTFGIDDVSATRSIRIFNSTNPANNGTYPVVSVVNGEVTILGTVPFVSESGIEFEVVDSADQSAKVLFTDDLALGIGQSLRSTIVDVRDASFFDAGWINAYESLERIEVDIVVPLPTQTISAIFQNGVQHVKSMSNIKNRRERVLFIGAIQGLTPENVIGTEPAAVEDIGILEGIQGDDVFEILNGDTEDLADYGVQDNYGNTFRVMYFYPDEIVVQLGADRFSVSGYYIAAAAAGYLSGVPNIAIPLTRKTLSGFTILRDKQYRPIILENLTASGITVLQPVAGGGVVIRGQTTTNSGFLEEREISIVFIRDRIAKVLRRGFNGFIGQPESSTVRALLTSRASSLLTGFINQGLITRFKDLKVSRDEVDPTQWNIVVKVQPTYPINYVFIRVSVGVIE